MIKRSVITSVLFIYLFSSNSLTAQTTDNNNQDRFQFAQKEWNVGLAYFGESFLRPGFSIAADRSINDWQTVKDIKKGTKFRTIALHLGGRYWNYNQPKSHVGNAIDLEFFIRKTKSFDHKNKIGILDFGVSAGLGWNRLHGGVYKPTETGFEKTNSRQAFFSYGVFLSLGNNLSNSTKIPLHWYIKPKLIVETPYAPLPQVHFALEAGINFPLSYFIKK